MTRVYAIFILFLFISFISKAQTSGKPVLEFEKTTHDFGTVPESGPITYEFLFTNKGTAPLIINDVKASCGCTIPSWTKEPIQPGQKGKITAQYNTQNRPGSFEKTLTVMTNTEAGVAKLIIKGNVLPRVKTPEELYPKKIGKLRMISDYVYLGKVTTEKPKVTEVILYNEGPDSLKFNAPNLPSYIEVSFHPQKIAMKEKAIMKISYNAVKKNELGPVEDDITIITNEASENKKPFHLVAELHDFYPPLSAEDAANAPKLTLSKTAHDFGNIKFDSVATLEIEITNPGKQDLHLKKIRSGASYITLKTDKTVIKPGKSAKLSIIYKPSGKGASKDISLTQNNKAQALGADYQNIWIHSNDPLSPTTNITIKANIIQ